MLKTNIQRGERVFPNRLADELDRPGSALNDSPRAIAHIEKAIRALLLDCLAQIYPRELRGEPTVVPASLERIEKWMDANIEEAISVEDMAAVAGISVRATQAAFRRYRDCTPSEAMLLRRLQRARALLLRPAPATTVTGVAFDVGLCHLGRFAARYAAMFGESPSETLAAARLGLGVFTPSAGRPENANDRLMPCFFAPPLVRNLHPQPE